MTGRVVALCTVGSAEAAERIAQTLVERRVAACVNIVPGVRSIYRWKGEICRDAEWLLVMYAQRDTVAPEQSALEADYRETLASDFGIRFNSLFTITNAPIGRFAAILEREGRLLAYHRQLAEAFNPDTLPGLMCRNTVSVAWDGSLYDCDFNQAIGMTLDTRVPSHVREDTPERGRGRSPASRR